MGGYPQFSLWISITLVKICFSRIASKPRKNTFELVGTVLKRSALCTSPLNCNFPHFVAKEISFISNLKLPSMNQKSRKNRLDNVCKYPKMLLGVCYNERENNEIVTLGPNKCP